LYSTPSAILEKPAAAISAAAVSASVSVVAKSLKPVDMRKGGHYTDGEKRRHW
jgi:hypothetical protein